MWNLFRKKQAEQLLRHDEVLVRASSIGEARTKVPQVGSYISPGRFVATLQFNPITEDLIRVLVETVCDEPDEPILDATGRPIRRNDTLYHRGEVRKSRDALRPVRVVGFDRSMAHLSGGFDRVTNDVSDYLPEPEFIRACIDVRRADLDWLEARQRELSETGTT